MYILQSEKTGKFYIGSTGNLEDRLIRHYKGRSIATKQGDRGNWFLQRNTTHVRKLFIVKWKLNRGRTILA